MRISDWSSDVCSSDLAAGGRDRRADAADARLNGGPGRLAAQTRRQLRGIGKLVDVGGGELIGIQRGDLDRHVARFFIATLFGDRKIVVDGKSVPVRVDLGGRRLIQKKIEKYKKKD